MFCVLSPVQLPNNSGAGPGTSREILVIKINFRLDPGPGGEIFLKITLFNSVNGPNIVLKSVICHPDPGPDGKFFLKMTKYFYLKKKYELDRNFF
jgi:hypothetical protein